LFLVFFGFLQIERMVHTMSDIEKMREEKARLAKQIQDFHSERSEKWDADCDSQWEKMNGDYDAMREQLDRAERAAEIASAEEKRQRPIPFEPVIDHNIERQSDEEARNHALKVWGRYNTDNYTEEAGDAEACQRAGINPRAKAMRFDLHNNGEMRAQSVGTGSEGGFTSPQGFVPELEAALLHFGGVRECSRVIRTDTGNQLDWPAYDDTANSGALLGENTQEGEQDVTFTNVNLDAYKYSSDIVRVSVELMQDSAFNLESELARILGTRLGRITNTAYTTGTGSSQPNGVVTASAAGVTAAATGAITADEVIDLVHSLDIAYRGNGKFMAKDSTLQAIRKLKDGDNRYLWGDGSLNGMQADTLLGYPVVTNNDMAALGASAKSVLFGDFSKYIIRDVRDITVVRMDERYADYLQVGFVAFLRTDSDLVDGGGNAIVRITQAAS
jgi:HK97 family phage major capsid protein